MHTVKSREEYRCESKHFIHHSKTTIPEITFNIDEKIMRMKMWKNSILLLKWKEDVYFLLEIRKIQVYSEQVHMYELQHNRKKYMHVLCITQHRANILPFHVSHLFSSECMAALQCITPAISMFFVSFVMYARTHYNMLEKIQQLLLCQKHEEMEKVHRQVLVWVEKWREVLFAYSILIPSFIHIMMMFLKVNRIGFVFLFLLAVRCLYCIFISDIPVWSSLLLRNHVASI